MVCRQIFWLVQGRHYKVQTPQGLQVPGLGLGLCLGLALTLILTLSLIVAVKDLGSGEPREWGRQTVRLPFLVGHRSLT